MFTPTRRTSAAVLTVLVSIVMFAAACSKAQNTTTAGPPATNAPDTTSKPVRTDKTERAGTTVAKRRATSTTEGSDGGDGSDTPATDDDSSSTTSRGTSSYTTITVKPTAGNEEFCEAMETGFNNLISHINAGSWSTEAEMMEAVAGWYTLQVDKAPAEIKAEFEKTAEAFKGVTSIAELTEKFRNNPDLAKAGGTTGDWLEANCGINPQLPIG